MTIEAKSFRQPTIESVVHPISHPCHSRSKRLFDRICALVLAVVALPVLVVIYCLVRLDGGPAFFIHKRIGAGGKPFKCIKFRTMVPDGEAALRAAFAADPALESEWRETHKLKRDPRVTKIGYVLRTLSLDELPQLFNVLRDEMSLVGPRPITSDEVERYGHLISYYYRVRPGITGLWQISGRSSTTYQRRVQLDVQYAREWSFWTDLVILVKTVRVVLLREGAH